MKKVRLAFAAAAAPVLGVVALPAAHAATTTADNPGTATHVTPHLLCYSQNVRAAFNPAGTVRAEIIFGGNSCVAYQQLRLDYAQTGYAERIRLRNVNNGIVFSDYLAGTISGNATYWSSRPNRYAYEVCGALVPNGNHNKVVWGPVCNFTDAKK
jgi:hypothetical protein